MRTVRLPLEQAVERGGNLDLGDPDSRRRNLLVVPDNEQFLAAQDGRQGRNVGLGSLIDND